MDILQCCASWFFQGATHPRNRSLWRRKHSALVEIPSDYTAVDSTSCCKWSVPNDPIFGSKIGGKQGCHQINSQNDSGHLHIHTASPKEQPNQRTNFQRTLKKFTAPNQSFQHLPQQISTKNPPDLLDSPCQWSHWEPPRNYTRLPLAALLGVFDDSCGQQSAVIYVATSGSLQQEIDNDRFYNFNMY